MASATPKPGQKTTMLSSTSLDLPEHRKQVVEACWRERVFPKPVMPPFDPSKFEPMPEVEINPKDEFYVEIESEE